MSIVPSTPRFTADQFDALSRVLLDGTDEEVREALIEYFNIVLNALAVAAAVAKEQENRK